MHVYPDQFATLPRSSESVCTLTSLANDANWRQGALTTGVVGIGCVVSPGEGHWDWLLDATRPLSAPALLGSQSPDGDHGSPREESTKGTRHSCSHIFSFAKSTLTRSSEKKPLEAPATTAVVELFSGMFVVG